MTNPYRGMIGGGARPKRVGEGHIPKGKEMIRTW
jgi:hypothetical protein